MTQNYMLKAIQLSQEGAAKGAGGPFGALIVKDGQIIGQAYNEVLEQHDPTAHAEVGAIRRACLHLKSVHLEGCALYTSCEPCPMCLSAAYWARIDRIWYACTRNDAARYGFNDAHIYSEISLSPEDRSVNLDQMMRVDALKVFEDWHNMPHRQIY